MNVFIVFCHPHKESFTFSVLEEFKKGLTDGGHACTVSDLYDMDFQSDMSADEYVRESAHRVDAAVPCDVLKEQEKINASEAIAFIYPVWWSDCPAKLKGWFDRVFTVGFAYGEGNRTMKQLEKVLFLCPAGHTNEYLQQTGIAKSMETVALIDRAGIKAKTAQMIILGGTVGMDEETRAGHLQKAYLTGKHFFDAQA